MNGVRVGWLNQGLKGKGGGGIEGLWINGCGFTSGGIYIIIMTRFIRY